MQFYCPLVNFEMYIWFRLCSDQLAMAICSVVVTKLAMVVYMLINLLIFVMFTSRIAFVVHTAFFMIFLAVRINYLVSNTEVVCMTI